MARYPRVSPTTSTLSAGVYSAFVERARSRKDRVYALQVGDTWRDPPACAQAEAQRTADRPRLHAYAPVQGEPVLLDAIQARLRQRHGESLDRESIQVMVGATAGLAVVVNAVIDPGDEVLVLAPFWPLIRGIVAARGATPVQVPFFDRLGAPGFDPEAAVERALTPRTVAIYVNTPNNPTGRVLPADVVAALARIARRHDLWVLSDDVYEDLAYVDPGPPVWTHPDLRDRTFSMHSFSKSHALAGARVGWAHGPAAAMRAVRGAQTFLTYSAPTPFQFAAARALAEGDEWLRETRALYAGAGRRAARALGLPDPEAGAFLFFDAAPFFRPGETLDGFLERCFDAGVLLTPGSSAGADYPTFVRLCFTAVPPDDLDEALARVRGVLGPRPERR
ncbi:MAG TPA: pyridoxal phosphate-dependent aminotransferase [Anaeromyxobacteraceae bacterium]|nr:pyridoxal phosphate-dependent aminotransferase [Anaeromyxobacteraceae bacterium]